VRRRTRVPTVPSAVSRSRTGQPSELAAQDATHPLTTTICAAPAAGQDHRESASGTSMPSSRYMGRARQHGVDHRRSRPGCRSPITAPEREWMAVALTPMTSGLVDVGAFGPAPILAEASSHPRTPTTGAHTAAYRRGVALEKQVGTSSWAAQAISGGQPTASQINKCLLRRAAPAPMRYRPFTGATTQSCRTARILVGSSPVANGSSRRRKRETGE